MARTKKKNISYDHIYLSYAENIKDFTSKLLREGRMAFAHKYIDTANAYLSLQGTGIRIIAEEKTVAIKIQ